MPFKTKPPLYSVWQSMRSRCRNPNNPQWKDYGGRGIDICPEWDSYRVFAADMGDRPPGHSIDRINNDLGYSPSNCRWADKKVQQRNRRITRRVQIAGSTYIAAELAERAGIKTDTVIERAERGLPLREVLSPEKLSNTDGLALGGTANGARQRAKTHCPHGHSYEDASINSKGHRRCRVCHRNRERERQRLIRAFSCSNMSGRFE